MVKDPRLAHAGLARDLNISTIQISERDTQASQRPKRQGEFINTWSIDGFVDELMQPSEFSFGTFEKRRPGGAREHRPGSGTLYMKRPGASTFARSWVPSIGGFQGMLVTHDEVFSIADHLSIRDRGKFTYRPSVMFVYHPCDDAMLSALELEGRGWILQPSRRRLATDIVEGMDELGVLLAGPGWPALFLVNNLVLASAIPVSLGVHWLVFQQRPGWLLSLQGRFRWRLFGRLLVAAVPLYLISFAVEALLTGGLLALVLAARQVGAHA